MLECLSNICGPSFNPQEKKQGKSIQDTTESMVNKDVHKKHATVGKINAALWEMCGDASEK